MNREVMQQAFDLLCDAVEPTATQIQADIGMCAQWDVDAIECIDTLRQALAQPEFDTPESHIVKWSIPVDPNNFGEPLAQPEQEHIECGYDETVGLCTNNPCCEQKPLPLAWATFDGEGNYEFRSYENNETYRDKYLNCKDEKYAKKYANWVIPLYTAPPPKREWVGLTDDEKESVYKHADAENHQLSKVVSAVEWLLKNKNTT